MALVPEGWGDPRLLPVSALPTDDDARHEQTAGGGWWRVSGEPAHTLVTRPGSRSVV